MYYPTNAEKLRMGFMPDYFEIELKYLNWKGKAWVILCTFNELMGFPTIITHGMIDTDKLFSLSDNTLESVKSQDNQDKPGVG